MKELSKLQKEILELKEKKGAVIIAHSYQIDEIQEIADYVGDSLALSKIAKEVDEDIIVFCGVTFMAETAKILSPEKEVLLPVLEAGCPMADMVDAEELREFKAEHPEAKVVCYVNSSADVKAECDICCTSSNAEDVVKSLDAEKVIFVPDQNLGAYVADKAKDKEFLLWRGFCPTHHRIEEEDILNMKKQHPDAVILVHPECKPDVLKHADFTGSTAQIISKAREIEEKKVIIGTENGVLYALRKENPDKEFILLSQDCNCFNMKKTSLEDVKNALLNNTHSIQVPKEVREKAYKSLDRMLSL